MDPAQPDAWNTRGLLDHEQRCYTAAEAAFRAAIRLRPGFAAAYINLGITLEECGRFSEATEALRAALRLEPDNAGR